MRGSLVIAVLWLSGCASAGSIGLAPVSEGTQRRVFIAPFELEPKDGPAAGRRLARDLGAFVSERVQALGHEISGIAEGSEIQLETGAALEFHPAGDVKVIRLFVRIRQGAIVLDDWAREPASFYFLPPTRADLEELSDEVGRRFSAALDAGVQKSMMH